MLAIQTARKSDSCSVNILPCRIQHNGPTKVTKRYWNVSTEKDGSKTVYFRGRKLKGSALRIPEGYKGVVVKSTGRTLPAAPKAPVSEDDSEPDEDDEAEAPVKILENVSEIKEILVWDHDQLPASDDAFRKGVDEFIAFADAIHS